MRVRAGFPRVIRWLVVPLVVIGLLTPAAPNARADDPRAELNQQQDKLKYIQQQKTQAANEYQRLTWQSLEAEQQLATVEKELAVVNSQLAVITNEHRVAQQELAKVEAELKVAQERYALRKEMLATRIRAINEGGRVNYLSVLLGANTFSDFISRFDMLKLIVKKDSELFEQVRKDKQVLEEKQQAATVRRNQLSALKVQMEERSQYFAQKREEQQVVSRNLELSRRRLQAQMAEFDRAEEAVQAEIAEIQRRMNRAAGRFAPIAPVKPVVVTDNFGPRLHPILGTWRPHNGTDFAANYGQAVYAIEDGAVIVARWDDAFGNLIVIDHGGGVASWYGHSSQLLVKVGDNVSQGQQIAKAGSTGWSTGPHVHLEIRVNGTAKNPASYIGF